ncbi:sulfotransferase [Thiohalobacter sp. IOR34]|uniref:sulfotransferase family protein n=1 Tax=Thiohalobacter sp. IOR34 TaxID=3057176 RepID=UPI0025B1DBF2|nr:sulfotransferase [Thiohalobacter sp. IOR34]WJW75304.1 sulfotransferase [Thiohalobacter sp. IOR34]
MIPLFLFSLPRSGSTLLQRVLSGHSQIATTSEPWVLLPLYVPFENGLCQARYSQQTLENAIADLCGVLPRGMDSYHAAVRAFAEKLYSELTGHDTRYFLDKTPRYHLVAHHIVEGFPDAKFLLLWRNPLATLGSRIHSYGGVWRLSNYRIDLFDGLANLVRVQERYGERIHVVQYENLLRDPDSVLEGIFEYLGLDFEPGLVESFSEIRLGGRMGDKSGVKNYTRMAQEPLEKWRTTLASPLRRMWCRRYLEWVGDYRLGVMGYQRSELLRELGEVAGSWRDVPGDAMRLAYSLLRDRRGYRLS